MADEKILRFETIAIGDELLTGQTIDSNSAFVGRHLLAAGGKLASCTVIPDDDEAILRTFETVAARCDVVFVFGGLGPTSDDRTVDCAARWLGCSVAVHGPSRLRLEKRFAERNIPLTESLLRQLRYPEAAEPLDNDVGLAPGFRCTRGATRFFFFPGVPREMEAIFTRHAYPELRALIGRSGRPMTTKTWRCVGAGESQLAEVLKPLEARLPKEGVIGYRALGHPENHVTLYWRGVDREAERVATQSTLKELLRPWCFSDEGKTLEEECVALLKAKKLVVAFAESATGGSVTSALVEVPGAAEVLWGGCVVYQRNTKRQLLGVFPPSEDAAVSAETSEKLARGLLEHAGVDVAVAVTGWLAPAPGTASDPVGTLYVAIVDRHGTQPVQRYVAPQRDRRQGLLAGRMRTLETLWRYLKELPNR